MNHRQNLIDLFTVSVEKIREFRHLTPLDRLHWLEDANQFRYKTVSKAKRDAWNKYMQRHNIPG